MAGPLSRTGADNRASTVIDPHDYWKTLAHDELTARLGAGGMGAVKEQCKLTRKGGAVMCKTIKHRVRFKIPPETIYDLLADSNKRTEITGCKALMSDEVGGRFSTDGGKVTGVNVDLVPGKRLVQAWRRQDFPDGIYSMAAITLDSTPGGGTELVLTHRGVPKHLLDQIEEYWRLVYWAPMKERR